MRELAERFLATLKPHLAPATVAEYDRYLQVFLRYCREQRLGQLRELRESHLLTYLQSLNGSSVSRQKHLQRALAFLAWARQQGLLLEDFVGVPRPRQRNQLPCVLSVEQVRSLLEAPNLATPRGLRDRLLLELLYVLGLRRAEAEALQLSHLDLAGRQLLVEGKGRQYRRLPLSPGLLTSLLAYLERGRPALAAPGETALLVSSRSGRRLGSNLYAIVKRHGFRVGLKVHPHQLRHACATHLLEAGADHRFIQELLGHRCPTTTGRYARARYPGLRQEFLRCHPRARHPPRRTTVTQDYLTKLDQSGRYSPGTLALTAHWLELLERWAAVAPDQLTPADMDRWCHDLTWKPGPSGNLYSENTRSQAIRVVRRFFEWAVSCGHLASNPAAHLQPPTVPPRPRRVLDPDQARRLLDAPDPYSLTGLRDRAVLGVVLETRASRPACARLDLDHLQLDTGALLTRGRIRQVHSLSEELLTDLSRYLDFVRPALARAPQSALFLTLTGQRLSAPAIGQLIRYHADRAGVPRP